MIYKLKLLNENVYASDFAGWVLLQIDATRDAEY